MTRVLGKWVAVALLAAASLWSVQPQAAIKNTKHDLSASSSATVKATDPAETQTCVFCHVPHNSSSLAPLWNRNNPAAAPAYTKYESSTTKGTMGQPNGSSLLCLSCHDGSIALGETLSRTIAVAGTNAAAGKLTGGISLIGRDLSDDHPVSFAYNAALVTAAAGELASPATLTGKIKLDKTGQMQCSSCHDAHDNINGKFLVVANTASALCIACHTKSGWSTSSHATSTKTWSGLGTNPWLHTPATQTTVASNACENCHQPHTALGKQRLLNYAVTEEANCYTCHGGTTPTTAGTVAAKNIQTEVLRASAHSVSSYTGVHDPVEAAIPLNARHVECADCHNPHQTNTTAGTATAVTGMPTLPGSLKGVSGVDILGTAKLAATYEYEVCFRCHGDSTGKKASTITRTITTQANNVRLEFQTTNSSYHPVAGVGKTAQANMPSLAAITLPGNSGPLTASSTITCTSCHSNNTGPQAAPTPGTGPNGPHGSTISPLLTAQYTTADNTTDSLAAYALCYKCHDRTNLRSTQATSFGRYHALHLGIGAPCSSCHDPHGVSTNPKLINFDTSIVTGARTFTKNAGNGGSCNLTCHGKNHNPFNY
jgi:predicted CXXCH cytochrome family protein